MLKSEKLHVALVQFAIIWEDVDANLAQLSVKINSITKPVDLIVLPEMFTTGFTINAENLAETMNGKTVNWMLAIAFKKQIAIAGSIIISENGKFYNRMLFVHPSGKIDFYDKRHTFTLAKENEVFSAGNKRQIINFRGWKVCLQICYDLRFPVWCRNVDDYDVLLYVASWPKIRTIAWSTLLKARAIENMSYTLGVNRVGIDGNNFKYIGHSIIFDALGNPLTEENNEKEEIIMTTLCAKEQEKQRNTLGFLQDRDLFSLQ